MSNTYEQRIMYMECIQCGGRGVAGGKAQKKCHTYHYLAFLLRMWKRRYGTCRWHYERVPTKRYADIVELGGIIPTDLRNMFWNRTRGSIKLNIGSQWLGKTTKHIFQKNIQSFMLLNMRQRRHWIIVKELTNNPPKWHTSPLPPKL